MTRYKIKRMFLMIFCSLFGKKFTDYINKKTVFIIYHRSHCGRKGRCIECGRYICEGCNTEIANEYGYCSVCSYGNKVNDVILPIKPLIKPKNIERYLESCNDEEGYEY